MAKVKDNIIDKKNNTSMDFEMLEVFPPQHKESIVKIFNEEVSSKRTYKIYIDDDVAEPTVYREVIDTCLTAGEQDTIIFSINTYGGDLYSCIAMVNAIRDSEAYTVAEVIHASSAGSFIALACDECIPLPHSDFFIHEVQSGTHGSLSTQVNTIEHMRKKQEAFFKDVYYGFLSEEEIDDILNGKSREGIYVDAEEALARLQLREELFQAELQEHIENETLKQSELKEDKEVMQNLANEYFEAKKVTKRLVQEVESGTLNYEDISIEDLQSAEYYLTVCNRFLTQTEEELLETLDFILDTDINNLEEVDIGSNE